MLSKPLKSTNTQIIMDPLAKLRLRSCLKTHGMSFILIRHMLIGTQIKTQVSFSACKERGSKGTSASIWVTGASGKGEGSSMSCQAGRKARRSLTNHAHHKPDCISFASSLVHCSTPLSLSRPKQTPAASAVLTFIVAGRVVTRINRLPYPC